MGSLLLVSHPVNAVSQSDLSVRCSPYSLAYNHQSTKQWTKCTATVTDSSPSVLFIFDSGSGHEGRYFDPATCSETDTTCQRPGTQGHLTCDVVNSQCSIEISVYKNDSTCFAHNGPCIQDVSVWASTDTVDGTDPNNLMINHASMTAVPTWGKVTFQDSVQNWGGPVQNNQLDYLIFWLPSSGCSPASQALSCTSSGGFVFDNPAIESAEGFPCGYTTPGSPPACSMASDSNYENLIVQYFHDIGGSGYYHSIVDQYNAGLLPPSGR